jgi:hypothetical protein
MKCSLTFGNNDLVAQLVEQRTFNAWAMGSSPIGVTSGYASEVLVSETPN